VLRIHVEGTTETTTLRLEGKLIQSWSDELVDTWMKLRARVPGQSGIQIDLEAVSFIDERGRSTLHALWRAGCELHGSGPFISALIEEIKSTPTV
jgi:ABC-type transporter Mla MlaB component